MAGVDHDHAAGLQPVLGELEELPRGQVERDVGLAVGVDEDRLPAPLGRAQERPRVVRVQPRVRPLAQAEPLLPQLGQLTVDLDAVDLRGGEVLLVRAHRRAGAVAEDGHGARRPAEHADRRGEVAVPDVVRQHRVASPDGVEGLALVELEAALAVVELDDPRVLLLRLALLEDARALERLRRPGRQQDQRGDRGGHEQVRARQRERGDEGDERGEDEEGALGADQRDQQQRRGERAEQRADRGEGVEGAGGAPRVLDAVDAQPDRPRRDGAEQQDRDGDQRQHADERAERRADVDVVEGLARRCRGTGRRRAGRARAGRSRTAPTARAGPGAAACRRGGRRASSRSRARRGRSRSCSPTRSWTRRRRAP